MFLGHVNFQTPNFRVCHNLRIGFYLLNTAVVFNIVSIILVIFNPGTSNERTIKYDQGIIIETQLPFLS